jgi:hypothetical protein
MHACTGRHGRRIKIWSEVDSRQKNKTYFEKQLKQKKKKKRAGDMEHSSSGKVPPNKLKG